MWEAMIEYIGMITKEVLGTSRGGGNKIQGAWWWNKKAKVKVKEKQEVYAALINSRTSKEKEANNGRYKS